MSYIQITDKELTDGPLIFAIIDKWFSDCYPSYIGCEISESIAKFNFRLKDSQIVDAENKLCKLGIEV